MELMTTLGRTLGFSFAAGVNLYATVAILGLASRFEWVALPSQFKVFDSDASAGVRFTAHTSFDDPTTRPDAKIRESIEMRAFAFY